LRLFHSGNLYVADTDNYHSQADAFRHELDCEHAGRLGGNLAAVMDWRRSAL